MFFVSPSDHSAERKRCSYGSRANASRGRYRMRPASSASVAAACAAAVITGFQASSVSSSSRIALIVGGDHTSAPEIDAAAVHAFAVEGHRDAAAAVDGNQAAAAAEAGDLRQGGAAGPGERFAPIAHAGRDVEREHRAQEELAVAGAGDGARGVVRVDAGADDRRIADAAWKLAGDAAGGGRRREVAGAIEGHRSDGAVVRYFVSVEIGFGNNLQSATARKALGAGPGEQHVPAVHHHLARGCDRVLD